MRETLDVISAGDPRIRAFVDFQPEQALQAARTADRRPAGERGPLHGLPIGVKEVFDVAGMRSTWGSAIHKDRVPGTDAECVRRMKAAGAIVVGTLTSTEYAIAAASPTLNPHDLSRTPGGSSSGPAAAVAAGMVSLALGSQTVGSIVRPSIYCGVYGLKPTHGAIPRTGGMTLSPPIDHPGVIAASPADIAVACGVLFGPSSGDSLSRDIAPPGEASVRGLRVLVTELMPPEAAEEPSLEALRRAQARLADAGARVEPFSFSADYGRVIDVLYTLMCHDMAVAHGGDFDRASGLMSPQLRELIERGRKTSAAEHDEAWATALRWRGEIEAILGGNAVLLSPGTRSFAPLLPEGTGSNRQQALWSLVGLPVIAVPAGLSGHMPVGVQIGASGGREDLLIAAAAALAEG